jgi:hypothetical protein
LGRTWNGGVVAGDRRALEAQCHLGEVVGRAQRGAAEDDVLHLAAAQAFGRALAHHPAQGLDDVGLAAAVGAHDAGEPGPDVELGDVTERFEAADAEPDELQGPLSQDMGQVALAYRQIA